MRSLLLCLTLSLFLGACSELENSANTPGSAETPNNKTSSSENTFSSSAEIVALASGYGFPAVENGGNIIGPFSGPENSIFYADKTGRVSYFSPTQMTAYFGKVDSTGKPNIQYMLTPIGNFEVQNGTPVQLQTPPDISPWPFSDPMIQVMIQTLTAYRNGLVSNPGWENASVISSGLHNINMNILQNMGNDGCTERYEGVYYLGCY